MASLDVQQASGLMASQWSVASAHPAALAAVPDAIVQHMDLAADALSCWAVHPHEQDGLRATAYPEERAELGPYAHVDVIELVRPRQHNVVWTDRFHLVATGAPAAAAGRIAGLYAGSEGIVVGAVHDRTAVPQVASALNQLAQVMGNDTGLIEQVAMQARFVFGLDGRAGMRMSVRAPAIFSQQVNEALARLQQLVMHW